MIFGAILSSKLFLELASYSRLRYLAPKLFLELYLLALNDCFSNSTIHISTQFVLNYTSYSSVYFGLELAL